MAFQRVADPPPSDHRPRRSKETPPPVRGPRASRSGGLPQKQAGSAERRPTGSAQHPGPRPIPSLLCLARYFENTPQFWLNLQAAHDLEVATRRSVGQIERDVHPREAA